MSVKPLLDDHPTRPRHAKTGLLLVNLARQMPQIKHPCGGI